MPLTRHSRYYKSGALEVDGRISLMQRALDPPDNYPDCVYHVLIGGETLDQLARKYYGREDLWWRIADANPRRFAYDWQPGEVLMIPPRRVATRTPRR